MKRTTALITAAVMALCMTACGDATEKTSEKKQESKTSATESQEENSANDNSESKTSREDLLKAANNNAQTGYNAVAEYLADLETQGKLSDAKEQEAVEVAVKELSVRKDFIERYNLSEINATVGVTIDINEGSFMVQFRTENDCSIIGQYPNPAQSLDDIPEWSAKTEASFKTAE